MVEYSQPRVQYQKNVQKIAFQFFFGIFLSIQGVQEAIREGPERIPELKNIQKNENFQNYQILISTKKIIIIIFRRAITIIIIIMAPGRQKDEFWLYIGRLRHGPNSIKIHIILLNLSIFVSFFHFRPLASRN